MGHIADMTFFNQSNCDFTSYLWYTKSEVNVMNDNAKNDKGLFMNKQLFYFSLWFFSLTLALVILPQPLDQLFGGFSTDWISIVIMLLGIIVSVSYMTFKQLKKHTYQVIIFPLIIYSLISVVIAMVDFGPGWGSKVMLLGVIIQLISLIVVIIFSIFAYLKQKAYQNFAELLIVILLHMGFVFDSAIIFYPEVYQSVPIFSLISYILSVSFIHIAYRMSEQNKTKE